MLYAYKRRLLRGFLGYINSEHDGGRRVPYTVSYYVDAPPDEGVPSDDVSGRRGSPDDDGGGGDVV